MAKNREELDKSHSALRKPRWAANSMSVRSTCCVEFGCWRPRRSTVAERPDRFPGARDSGKSPQDFTSMANVPPAGRKQRDLKPSETGYVRRTRSGTVPCGSARGGDPGIEKRYRTHYVSPTLIGAQTGALQERSRASPQPVVFQIVRDSRCSECEQRSSKDAFLRDGSGAAALPVPVRAFQRL